MSRSGYGDDCEYPELYRAAVDRAICGKRGQAFLRELASALDAMPKKVLIAGELVNNLGQVCAIGAVCKARALDVSHIVYEDPATLAKAIGVAGCLAAEIAYMNDEYARCGETPEQRWERMRQWVTDNLAQQTEKHDLRLRN